MAIVFHASHRTGYADCTVGNHVYHSRYLDFLESARGQFFRGLGRTFLQWQEQGTIFPVIECRLRYQAPARYDDRLDIEVAVTRAAGVRLNFGYRVLAENGKLLLEAETLHVCAGLNDKPKRLPRELPALLEPYLVQAAAEG